MVRALTRDQLASEAGVDVGRIERLTEIGALVPDRNGMYSAGDVIRVESVQPFIDAGMSLETLEEGIKHGLYTFEYLDRFYPEPASLSDNRVADLARDLSIPEEPALYRTRIVGVSR